MAHHATMCAVLVQPLSVAIGAIAGSVRALRLPRDPRMSGACLLLRAAGTRRPSASWGTTAPEASFGSARPGRMATPRGCSRVHALARAMLDISATQVRSLAHLICVGVGLM